MQNQKILNGLKHSMSFLSIITQQVDSFNPNCGLKDTIEKIFLNKRILKTIYAGIHNEFI